MKNQHLETVKREKSTFPGSKLVKCGVVLRCGSAEEWDAGMVESPMVWFDPTHRKYAMVYTGYAHSDPSKKGYDSVSSAQIGLAWSEDLFVWTKDARNPVLGPSNEQGSPDRAGATGPFVWLEDQTYYLFYIGTTAVGYEKGTKTLNLVSSPDLFNWRRYEGNPILKPEGRGWRRDAIWHPNILKVKDTYLLFFNASGVVDGTTEEFIGYATSKDLLHWKVDDENSPVLMGSRKLSSWDSTGRAGDPSLFKIGSKWYMAYYSWDGEHAQDGLAWTTEKDFPLGWQMYEENPVLKIGEPRSCDALHAAKPFILQTPERHYHFYTAVNAQETREIALAVWPEL